MSRVRNQCLRNHKKLIRLNSERTYKLVTCATKNPSCRCYQLCIFKKFVLKVGISAILWKNQPFLKTPAQKFREILLKRRPWVLRITAKKMLMRHLKWKFSDAQLHLMHLNFLKHSCHFISLSSFCNIRY